MQKREQCCKNGIDIVKLVVASQKWKWRRKNESDLTNMKGTLQKLKGCCKIELKAALQKYNRSHKIEIDVAQMEVTNVYQNLTHYQIKYYSVMLSKYSHSGIKNQSYSLKSFTECYLGKKFKNFGLNRWKWIGEKTKSLEYTL